MSEGSGAESLLGLLLWKYKFLSLSPWARMARVSPWNNSCLARQEMQRLSFLYHNSTSLRTLTKMDAQRVPPVLEIKGVVRTAEDEGTLWTVKSVVLQWSCREGVLLGSDWWASVRTKHCLAFALHARRCCSCSSSPVPSPCPSQGLYQHQQAHHQGHGKEDTQEEAVHHAGDALPVLMAALGSPVAAEGAGNGGHVVQQSFLVA